MKHDLDPCDVESLTRRHDELVRTTRALHERDPCNSAADRVWAPAARRIAAAQRFVVAVVLTLFGAFALVLAISMSVGVNTP